jgi:hypothetical protein
MGTTEAAARPAPRRSDAGHIRYTERDVTGLLLLAEHYAAPYDLLSAALDAPPARTRAVVARWRAAGLAGSDTAPAADAMRQRITDQFTARYDEAKALQAELDQIEAAQPAEDDPALLDELPYAAAAFDSAPEDIKAKIYAAFDIQVLYRAPRQAGHHLGNHHPDHTRHHRRPDHRPPAPTTTPRMDT